MKRIIIITLLIGIFSILAAENWGKIKFTHGVVNIRQNRNTSSPIISKLKVNESVKADFLVKNWYAVFNINENIKDESKAIGYVFADLLFDGPLDENKVTNKYYTKEIKYEVFDEEVYDAPIKTQIVLKIIIREKVTAEDLKKLLNTLYSQNVNRTGFKYHTNPTNIFIFIYNSYERAKSGGSQWIAMISKSYDEKTPSISINEEQIELQNKKKESKFGLSEDTRIEIWQEYILAEDRSAKEAEKKYPLTYPAVVTTEKMKKYSNFQDQLIKQYKSNLANKYNITVDQIETIIDEGINKQWPYPDYNKRF